MSTEVKVRQVTKTFARVIVNGSDKGEREINGGPSLKEFIMALAQEHGVKSFNVSIDGEPVKSAAQAEEPVRAGSTVAIQARDTRGAKTSKATEAHAEATATSEGMAEKPSGPALPEAAEATEGTDGDVKEEPVLVADGATA